MSEASSLRTAKPARRRGVRTPPAPQALSARIIHITSELWPYAFSGGLGYAVAELAQQQAQNGRDVTVIVPLYGISRRLTGPLWPACEPFRVHQAGADELIQCLELQRRGAGPRVIFVDHPASFDRAGIYGEAGADYGDNAQRYAILAASALEFARRMNEGQHVVAHAHDWPAALVPIFMRTKRAHDPAMARMSSVVTVHNAGYQGHFTRDTLDTLGLPGDLWSPEKMEWHGRLNLLKGALHFADAVTTVSATHAEEICSETGGFGLHDTFRALGRRLTGVRNGIDEVRWNPATDKDIPAKFSAANLEGKARCKADLQLACRLPRADVPVIAMSARLVRQKGLDLVLASRVVRESKAQFVFLGQGEPGYEASLQALAAEFPQRIHVRTTFDARFEHRLLAGADFLLMPSLYEPCGLTQMRAQRYGTLPIVRHVGGLAETVTDDRNGFVFADFDARQMDAALERAIAMHAHPGEHSRRMIAAMETDHSWTAPIVRYDEVYRTAMQGR